VTWPQPTRKDHESFCVIEGWRRVRDARGRTGTHHVPARGAPAPEKESLPADMVHLLITRVGVSEREVVEMTREEAVLRLQQYRLDGI
jgi:hypothetical protein